MEIDHQSVSAQRQHADNWKQLLRAFKGLAGKEHERRDYEGMEVVIEQSGSGSEFVVVGAGAPVIFTLMYTGTKTAKVVCSTKNPFNTDEWLHVHTFTLTTGGMTDFVERQSFLNLESWAFHIQSMVLEMAYEVRAAAAARFPGE